MEMETESRHQCLIYEGPPTQFLHTLAAVLQRRMNEGYRCLYLNSRPMVAGMRSCLTARGVDVVGEIARARLVLSSEPATEADGSFVIQRMLGKLEDALDQAIDDGYKGLFATGDMTWEFGSEKNLESLMEYEWGLERIFHRRPELCGICQYHRDTLPHEAMRQALLTHRSIFINDTLSRVNPHFLSPRMTGDGTAHEAAMDEMIAGLCQRRDRVA